MAERRSLSAQQKRRSRNEALICFAAQYWENMPIGIRKLMRYHLSTLIVLVFAAGALLLVNIELIGNLCVSPIGKGWKAWFGMLFLFSFTVAWSAIALFLIGYFLERRKRNEQGRRL